MLQSVTFTIHMLFVLLCPSAGIGRSGVFIGADVGMQQLEEGGEVDVARIVSTMRQDRGGMVQTKDQYVFLHQVRRRPHRSLIHKEWNGSSWGQWLQWTCRGEGYWHSSKCSLGSIYSNLFYSSPPPHTHTHMQLLFDYSHYLERLRSPYQPAPARLATTPEADEESDGSESSQELLISS